MKVWNSPPPYLEPSKEGTHLTTKEMNIFSTSLPTLTRAEANRSRSKF